MYGMGGMAGLFGSPMQQYQQMAGQAQGLGQGMGGLMQAPQQMPQMPPVMQIPQQAPMQQPMQQPVNPYWFTGPQNAFAMNVSASGDEPPPEEKEKGNRPWRVKVYEKSDEQRAREAEMDNYYAAEAEYKAAIEAHRQSGIEDKAAWQAGEISYEEYKRRRDESRARAKAAGEKFDAVEDPREFSAGPRQSEEQ